MKNGIILIIIALLASCSSSIKSSSSQGTSENYKSIATKKLGEDVDYFWNDSKTYVLCTHEINGTSQQVRNGVHYLVIKNSDNSIVLENKVQGSSVTWFDDDEIEIYVAPGMIRKDQTADDFKTLYNVETGKSRPKIGSESH